tara:strand:+ start:108 stop:773 length:666 start_codon:yes stop_codon:yes gene_type:complete
LIKESYERTTKKSSYHKYSSIEVFINDPLPDNIELNSVFSFINERIPSYMLDLIDVVYIGQAPELEDRSINAMYSNGAIYLTNAQDNEQDMIDDIVHEIAHALEDSYGQEIYATGEIKEEFLSKRRILERVLLYMDYDTDSYDFDRVEYNMKFDFFLHQEIGYSIIEPITAGTFVTSYAATSLREYFATGFEDYYLNSGRDIKAISPSVYAAIDKLNDMRY